MKMKNSETYYKCRNLLDYIFMRYDTMLLLKGKGHKFKTQTAGCIEKLYVFSSFNFNNVMFEIQPVRGGGK